MPRARVRRALADAPSVVLNVTAPGPYGAGYVRAYPCGSDPVRFQRQLPGRPGRSGNLAVVKVHADGRVCLSSYTPTDLVVDLAGWYTG
jgi:hypothetical protein